jgi:hypothetical protein
MRKSTIKRHFRKVLSILLAMTFIFPSAITLSAFADSGADVPANPSQLGSYYEVGPSGQGDVPYETSLKTAENGAVSVEKNISETGTENVFDINLIVKTQKQFTSSEVKGDAAVVLVMDVSNSMKDPLGKTTRMATAKAAAVTFVNNYITDASTARRMISIVEFGSNAKTVLGWTNAVTNTANVTNAINNDVSIGFTDSRIPGGSHSDDGGTNIEGGLTLAYNLLGQTGENQPLNGIGALYVVLLSDGCPTYHISSSADRSSLEFISGSRGGGNYAIYDEDVEPAEDVAEDIRTIAMLYSIAFASGSDRCYEVDDSVWVPGHWENGRWHWGHWEWNRTEVTIEQWLTSISNGYYSANDADELGIAFGKINTNIQHSTNAGTVTDPMGSNIVFDIDYFDGNSAFSTTDNTACIYFDTVTNQLTWNVSKSTPTTKTEGEITYYTYSLTYRIELDTVSIKNAAVNGDVDEDAYYLTNGRTTLTYTKTDGQDTVSATIDFRVPTVRAYFGSLNFAKVASYGNKVGLSGAVFTLASDDSTLAMTATSQADGSVSFTDIPAGFYMLTETTAPAGHDLNDDEYLVTVSYGRVTVMDSSEQTVTLDKIENDFTQEYVTISGSKVWANVPDGTTVPAITITLKQDGTAVNSVTLQPGTTTFSFTTDEDGCQLPKYRDDHSEYEYTVEEATVDGYTQSINGYTITNTYIDKYYYRIDCVYTYYLDGAQISSQTVTGTVTEGAKDQIISVNPSDYQTYGGRTYSFLDGASTVTLNVKNGVAVLTLYYAYYDLTPPVPKYQYRIDVTYNTYKDGALDSTEKVTGTVVETTDPSLTIDTDDYKTFGGNEYAFVSGPTFMTLESEELNVIELVYERNLITPPTPPETTNYQYRIDVTYRTLKDGALDSTEKVTGTVVETTDPSLTINKDDYKTYGGNEYAYVSGPTSVTLESDGINVIELVYERNLITPPTPPYTGITGNTGLLALLAAVSGASLITIAVVGKKQRKAK